MWFDSRPGYCKPACVGTLDGTPVPAPALPRCSVGSLAAASPAECACFVRTMVIKTSSAAPSQQLVELVSAFGDLMPCSQSGQELLVRFYDCRDCYKALTLVPKFSECKIREVVPVEEDLVGVSYTIDSSVSKEELWYEVSKRGDIAWSKAEQIPGGTAICYAVFDKRVVERLAAAPIVLNDRALAATLAPLNHAEICRFQAKSSGESLHMSSPTLSSISLSSTASSLDFLDAKPKLKKPIASPPLAVAQLAEDKEFGMKIPGHLTPPLESQGFQAIPRRSRASASSSTASTASSTAAPGARSNRVDCDLICAGRERRTTVMLRNIPNKVNLAALRSFLDETNENEYDFLYLRMDFNNKCNVGYAFINFTRPESVATLAQARRGKKWTQYNSVKIIDVSFANIQGRRALIEKFRDSPIMAMDPEYRPKLYHTSGPLAGKEERFS